MSPAPAISQEGESSGARLAQTPAEHETILAELTEIARRPERQLLQFLSLASAFQYRRLYRLFARYVPAGAEVLDWGAGYGHFSYFLARSGYRATGFSLLPCEFRSWLGDPDYRFVQGDATDPVRLPFEESSFDAVASVGVLEHVRETGGDEAASLAEIARVLRPGGTLVTFHFPNRTSWIDSIASRVPGKHHHVYRYDRGDIERLVRGAGLELLETKRYAVLPRNTVHRLLGPLRDSRWAAELWDGADALLGVPLAPFCQNHYFVARRPGAPE